MPIVERHRKTKRRSFLYRIFLSLVLLTACAQKSRRETSEPGQEASVKIPSPSIEALKLDPDAHRENCRHYWARLDSLNQIKVAFFEKNVFIPAMKNQSLSIPNRRFMEELKKQLLTSQRDLNTQIVFKHVLQPIFSLPKQQTAIVIPSKFEYDNDQGQIELNPERLLINSTNHFKGDELSYFENKLVLYPSLFDSLFGNPFQVFAFTAQRRHQSSVTNFGYNSGECFSYYQYALKTDSILEPRELLFASTHALELVFGEFPEMDNLIENSFEDCYDCSSGYQTEKAFAMISGVERLYFTFSDSVTAGKPVDFPKRSLIMKINDSTKVDLWSESADLFGCPCL